MSGRELRLIAIAGTALSLVIGFLIWSLSTKEPEIALDSRDMCPKDRVHITSYAMLLLDVSEPIVGGNAEELERRILKIGRSLKKHGKLTIYNVHEISMPIVSRCRPQTRAECDPKTAPRACKGVQEAYERNFEAPIVKQVGEFLSRQAEQQSSPIIEAIKDVSLLTDFTEISTGAKSLHIVSDMLQNTPGVYSHQRGVISPNEFTNLSGHSFYIDHKPDLGGVAVDILYLLRRKYRIQQSVAHKTFWRDYFESSGAETVNITPLNFAGGDRELARQFYPPVPAAPVERAITPRPALVPTARSTVPAPVPTPPRQPAQTKIVTRHDKLVALLGREPIPYSEDENGWTDLHYAAILDLPDLVDELAGRGADVNARTSGDGLLMKGQVINVLNSFGHSTKALRRRGKGPLHYAAIQNATKATTRLIRRGADMALKDMDGGTPLHDAVIVKSNGVVKLLIDSGANPNVRNNRLLTPLHVAAWIDEPEILSVLLTGGAHIDSTDINGQTPLHSAAFRGAERAAKTLIMAGANINARDRNRKTPLSFAKENRANPGMIDFLLQNGARSR